MRIWQQRKENKGTPQHSIAQPNMNSWKAKKTTRETVCENIWAKYDIDFGDERGKKTASCSVRCHCQDTPRTYRHTHTHRYTQHTHTIQDTPHVPVAHFELYATHFSVSCVIHSLRSICVPCINRFHDRYYCTSFALLSFTQNRLHAISLSFFFFEHFPFFYFAAAVVSLPTAASRVLVHIKFVSKQIHQAESKWYKNGTQQQGSRTR